MDSKKFDPEKLQKLNNPRRLIDIPPDYIWDKLAIKSPGVLVEIGAGTAFFSIAFTKYSRPSRIYACDLSEIMVEWMQENVAPAYPGIIPVKTEEDSVPLDDEMADLVFMVNLHHELDAPSLTMDESYRILKPHGEIFIVDWKKQDMQEGPPVEIRLRSEQVREHLANAGFKSLNIYDGMPKHFLVVGEKYDPRGQ